jgi:hypothetical protein
LVDDTSNGSSRGQACWLEVGHEQEAGLRLDPELRLEADLTPYRRLATGPNGGGLCDVRGYDFS